MNANPGIPVCEITLGESDPSCECMTCQEYRLSIRMPKNEKKLYCVAFTYWSAKQKKWVGDKNYTHAENVEEARLTFWQSLQSENKVVNIVGVAPVIGYFVKDSIGQELTV